MNHQPFCQLIAEPRFGIRELWFETELVLVLLVRQIGSLRDSRVVNEVLRDVLGTIYLLFGGHDLPLLTRFLTVTIIRFQHCSIFLDGQFETRFMTTAHWRIIYRDDVAVVEDKHKRTLVEHNTSRSHHVGLEV
jgi:hypothetical protein